MTPWTRKEIIGDCTLYLGDCKEIIPHLGKVDAVVTDPPYGIGRDKGMGSGGHCGKSGKKRNSTRYPGEWDQERPDPAILSAVLDCCDRAVIWGGQFFASQLPVSGKWLWWDKQQTMPSYGDGELAWTNLPGDACKKFTYSLNGMIARGETGQHPTQKPVPLMSWCLSFLPRDASVLDPFMGSGTTGVACVMGGRSFLGVERHEPYFDVACERIRTAYNQRDMFVAAPSRPIAAASQSSMDFGSNKP